MELVFRPSNYCVFYFSCLLLLQEETAPFYVGLLYGLIVLTRFTAAVGIIFYVFLLLFENGAAARVTKALMKNYFSCSCLLRFVSVY